MHQVMPSTDTEQYRNRLNRMSTLRAQRIIAQANAVSFDGQVLTSSASIGYFLDIVSYLQHHGVAVLVIEPPNVWYWTADADFIAQFTAACHDQPPLVDFGDARKYRELFLPPEIRYDDAHLNGAGAVIWSRVLAKTFAELLRRGRLGPQATCQH